MKFEVASTMFNRLSQLASHLQWLKPISLLICVAGFITFTTEIFFDIGEVKDQFLLPAFLGSLWGMLLYAGLVYLPDPKMGPPPKRWWRRLIYKTQLLFRSTLILALLCVTAALIYMTLKLAPLS